MSQAFTVTSHLRRVARLYFHAASRSHRLEDVAAQRFRAALLSECGIADADEVCANPEASENDVIVDAWLTNGDIVQVGILADGREYIELFTDGF